MIRQCEFVRLSTALLSCCETLLAYVQGQKLTLNSKANVNCGISRFSRAEEKGGCRNKNIKGSPAGDDDKKHIRAPCVGRWGFEAVRRLLLRFLPSRFSCSCASASSFCSSSSHSQWHSGHIARPSAKAFLQEHEALVEHQAVKVRASSYV